MSSGVVFLSIGIAAALFSVGDAADFLHAGQVNEQQLEENLLSELADMVRPGSDNVRIPKIEADLSPIFSIVPAEGNGTVSHHVARYVLHRWFVSKHGWFIRGLEPDGDHRDDASEESHAMTNLQEWVPSYLQKFLETLNSGRGLSLRETAIFAATLEDLIHKEALSRLELAWDALGFPRDMDLYSSQVKKVMETYMVIYNQGGNFTADTREAVEEHLKFYSKKVKDWVLTQAWLRKVRTEVFPPPADGVVKLNYSQAQHLIEEIGERYGAFNDEDCSKLKKELLQIESPKRIGRVRLADFWKKGLYSVWEFTEKKEYLRSLGALDETDPKQPFVIVPNYVAARPNCLVCSNFYVVCCRNECEDLMTKIETEVGKPLVAPDKLLRLVSRLSSDTVQAPRKLSESLMDRIHEVAVVNGGRVPIHGRLFAQWMHHAFPRECPYPHEAGKANPQTPDEWMLSAGHGSHKASEEEMREHADTDDSSVKEDTELPWTDEEELLTERQAVKRRPWRKILLRLTVFGVLGAMLTGATLSFRSYFGAEKRGFGRKSHYA